MKLTVAELNAARGFLIQARVLVQGVSSLFFGVEDSATAARLNDIGARLADEISRVETRLARKP